MLWKFSFQDQGVPKFTKKTHVESFFQFLMLNISSIKELLHKPSEVPGKLKRKIPWALSYKILPPEITKTWEIAIFGVFLGAWEPMFFMILWISGSFNLYLLVVNSFNFELGFFTHFGHISGGIIRKNILHSDCHSVRWYWYKKDQKNHSQTLH